MVLDIKVMTWAGRNGLETAKLKAAKVPIYGKWYFPEVPANLMLINLETGEVKSFPEKLLAGEVAWVAVRDLRRANLLPESMADQPDEPAPTGDAARAAAGHTAEAEPLLAMARPPVPVRQLELYEGETIEFPQPPGVIYDQGDASGVHLPMPSIAPFLLAVGTSIALLGVIVHPLVLLVGLAWVAAGSIAWIRVGLLEAREAAAHTVHS
jgi:hypothetical protein